MAAFADEYQLSFPVWLDPENVALRGFHNSALPNSYLVDPQGKVVMGWSGAISREMLEENVTPLLKE